MRCSNFDNLRLNELLDRMPRSVKSKSEFYLLYNSGALGPTPLKWNSYKELLESGYQKKVCIRSKDRGLNLSPKETYNIPVKDLPRKLKEFKKRGINTSKFAFNQAMPDNHLTIQGEVKRTEFGLFFKYSKVQEPMKIALAEDPHEALGFQALCLLKGHLFPSSFSDLEAFLEIYPDSIIELSAYDICILGSGKNTVFWEVRTTY